MSEYTERLIKDHAEKIRNDLKKLDGIALLYGEPFDFNNPDALLVMATCITEERFAERRPRAVYPFIVEKI